MSELPFNDEGAPSPWPPQPRSYDKHNGVDQLCFFVLSLGQRRVFSVTCSGNSFISQTQMSCKLHHWAFTPNVYGERSAVRPGRESAVGDRTIRLPWLRRLLLETESRVLTDTGVYQHHHRIRSFRRQQPTSTATSKPVSIYFRDIDRAAVADF